MPESEPKYSVTLVGQTTVVKLLGPRITDQVYINELGDELVAVLEQASPIDVLVDLNAVEFLSSSVLGKLIRLLKRSRQMKGRLRLCSIRPSILEVFEITQLHKVFDIYPDADEALSQT
ncbi:STAS domain-containing protein [bacterium]|nr:STAS domain-containing protein [bacterium]